ncbi:MAG: type II CRISPR RNA-guided endonuclease Cas9 [Tidjanibacter sp.]|nr:type II CRISPR RNA-guided endonuclease Cas9 [Tidjanibacter sp.]
MKKVLGLDLGSSSIGWAVVNESENPEEKSSIIKLGVRVNPLTVDELSNFEQGKSITTNADRSLKHGMRLNLKRYKMRRENLVEVLKSNGFIDQQTVLSENGNATTFQTYRLRAKAVVEEISLEELSRVLLMLNKKRGYKSNRKAKNEDEDGALIDGMGVARELYDRQITPGQYVYEKLCRGGKKVPDFYRSDLTAELDTIWACQQPYYPDILTDDFKKQIANKGGTNVSKIFLARYGIFTAQNKGKERRLQAYAWRNDAVTTKLSQDIVAYVICDISSAINNSSGYLGAISDRSKELFFNHQTVGQYIISQLDADHNVSLKNMVFYRQDYLDEFEKIWETQKNYHPELTPQLKHEIRDVIIFYQRRLKSKKGTIAFCEFENHKQEITVDGKPKTITVGLKVCPKSSPLFQEFKTWQVLNNLTIKVKGAGVGRALSQDEKEILFEELKVKASLTKVEALKLINQNSSAIELNFKTIEGNRTQAALFDAYRRIIEASGNGEFDFSRMSAAEIATIIRDVFGALGFNTEILEFDSTKDGEKFENQECYRLWHLLYSYEGDDSKSGNEKLIEKLTHRYGFDRESAAILAGVVFQDDYGSLSAKAMRKILPYMRAGNEYSLACELAGYRHSQRSLTKEELDNKILVDRLDILPRNSLRNPVVEKILNQMINVVNELFETFGKPDEIRIELARELKKSSKERQQLTNDIKDATKRQEECSQILQSQFGIASPTRNDIIRYRLYKELEGNGYKTLYTNTCISREKLFGKDFDIEHIIPQSKLFDDSFSNKTLEARDANIEKGNFTAYDYVSTKFDETYLQEYRDRIERLYNEGAISRAKRNKLIMREADIPEGFIERDLRDSQYIAKKAREILESTVKFVVPTTGSITDRLREDWQLIDVMKELNWDKYNRLGLTETVDGKDGHKIYRIKDWTKRNDHRHHAMDALTIAFTKRSYIQYLNHLNARRDEKREFHAEVIGIERKELYRSGGNLLFLPPMPLDEFRAEAKRHLGEVLISIKSKNKVATPNVNITKAKVGNHHQVQLTPRGQLHNETVYGLIKRYSTKLEKVGSSFDAAKIATVTIERYRNALLGRLAEFDNNPKKAFTGKNSLETNPLYTTDLHTEQVPERVKTLTMEDCFTIRKAVDPKLIIDKVVDVKIQKILQARLDEFGGDARKAFTNLDENPIWLNQSRGIAIKRVSIKGVSNAIALHDRRDKEGRLLLDDDGCRQPVDYVSTSNNHHVAIFRDSQGELQEHIVSFFEAVERKRQNLTVIDKDYNADLGWKFLFTMKQNEYFVFPRYQMQLGDDGLEHEVMTFDPNEIDLLDPKNYPLISPNLFRVQKMSSKYYVFRHHLETTVEDNNVLQGITWKRVTSLKNLCNIIKVRVNHIGQIVQIGEY